MFKTSGKSPGNGFLKRPETGGRPEGGYGAAEAPGRAQRLSAKKGKPSGSYGSAGKRSANKPKGGYGAHASAPKAKKPKVTKSMGSYGNDGMSWPEAKIPKDQKTGRFNLPKGKFV